MQLLGLDHPWAMVISFIATLPDHNCTTPEIVSVDCVEPIKNRVKVYLRTQASSLNDIINLMTLGGELSSPSISSTIDTLRHLWLLLFGPVGDSISIPSKTPDHYASGFVVYFEMALGRTVPVPKVYIPVRHYCRNDEEISKSLAQYYREIGIPSIGDRYLSDMQNILFVPFSLLVAFHLTISLQHSSSLGSSHRNPHLYWMRSEKNW